MLIFSGHVQLMELANRTVILSGNPIAKFECLSPYQRETLQRLTEGIPDSDPAAKDPFVQDLVERTYVVHLQEDYDTNGRFSRQIEYLAGVSPDPINLQSSLSEKKLLIVGCGGTGSMVIQALIGHGFKRFALVDDDVVQASNFNRQLFFREAQLGSEKVSALSDSIKAIQSDSHVETLRLRIKSQMDFESVLERFQPDFLICGADSPPLLIQKWSVQACQKFKTPLIFGGVGATTASLGPLLDTAEARANYVAWIDRKLSLLSPDSLRPLRGSLASTNMACSSLMAFEVFKYFSARGNCLTLNSRLIFDFATYGILRKEQFNESTV